MDAAEYEHVVLGPLFLERVCDALFALRDELGALSARLEMPVTLARLRRSWRRLRSHAHEACPDCGGLVPGYTSLIWMMSDEPGPTRFPPCGIWLDGAGCRSRPASKYWAGMYRRM